MKFRRFKIGTDVREKNKIWNIHDCKIVIRQAMRWSTVSLMKTGNVRSRTIMNVCLELCTYGPNACVIAWPTF